VQFCGEKLDCEDKFRGRFPASALPIRENFALELGKGLGVKETIATLILQALLWTSKVVLEA
jgi:hypothetical protein